MLIYPEKTGKPLTQQEILNAWHAEHEKDKERKKVWVFAPNLLGWCLNRFPFSRVYASENSIKAAWQQLVKNNLEKKQYKAIKVCYHMNFYNVNVAQKSVRTLYNAIKDNPQVKFPKSNIVQDIENFICCDDFDKLKQTDIFCGGFSYEQEYPLKYPIETVNQLRIILTRLKTTQNKRNVNNVYLVQKNGAIDDCGYAGNTVPFFSHSMFENRCISFFADNELKNRKNGNFGSWHCGGWREIAHSLTSAYGAKVGYQMVDTVCERVQKRIEATSEKNDYIATHDALLFFENIYFAASLCTPSVMWSILNQERLAETQSIFNELYMILRGVEEFYSPTNARPRKRRASKTQIKKKRAETFAAKKAIKSRLYKAFCRYQLTSEIAAIKQELDVAITQKIKIFTKEKDIKIAADFVACCRKYSNSISLSQLVYVFGKQNTRKIILGTMDGLFFEHTIFPAYTELGNELKTVMATRTGQIRRIWNEMKNRIDWNKVFSGEISREEAAEIIERFRVAGVNLSKSASTAHLMYGKIEKKCSPEFLMAGNASVCCMSFGSGKAVDYAIEKGFGIYNIYYKGRVIANSLLWIDEKTNALVIDNIEIHPNYKEEKYRRVIRDLFTKMITHIGDAYEVDGVLQGTTYNDFCLYTKTSADIRGELLTPKEVTTDDFYSDASHSAKIILEITPKFKDNLVLYEALLETGKNQRANDFAENMALLF